MAKVISLMCRICKRNRRKVSFLICQQCWNIKFGNSSCEPFSQLTDDVVLARRNKQDFAGT